MTAATNLASNENVLIVKADKGKQAVLWERDDYIVEAQKHLGSPSYEKCDLNAVKVAVNNVSTLVMKYLGKNVIDKDTANKLVISSANAVSLQSGYRNVNYVKADVVLRECESDTKEIKDIFVDRCSLIDICYFDYEKAFDILINNSSNEKNMFGQFLCPKLKALDSALVNYRKQNAHIAEASYILMNGIHFALPTLKKQINKSSLKIKQIESSLSRVQRLKLSAESTIKHHMTEWKIDMGESFEDAIDSKAICLSEICNEIGLKAISIKRAYEFYSLFVSTFHSKKPETVMDALLYLIEHGNTTVYEMKHHVAPASLCRPQVNLKNEHVGIDN
ncbi:hypothetical protein GJ496_001288 [Pomphorhynchus laevis]|nr:hypothetical protein GJ496_001288 [Pomphorhynchus laevis]